MRDTKTEPPDFVNAENVKWWMEPTLTNYALSKGLYLTKCWTVEDKAGFKTRLLTESGKILAEDKSLEGIGIKIDILSVKAKKTAET